MINRIAIRLNVAPKDGNLNFDISECEAMLPVGTVDKNVEKVFKEVHRISSQFYYELFLADKYACKHYWD